MSYEKNYTKRYREDDGALAPKFINWKTLAIIMICVFFALRAAPYISDALFYYKDIMTQNIFKATVRVMATLGDADEQIRLAWMYEHGLGVEKNYGQALMWYRRAAEQGHSHAQNNLASMYANGRGVERNYPQAAAWSRKAAALDQVWLELMYVTWYRKAAEEGLANAQNNLAWMYVNGRGVERNYGQAIEWIRKAAEQGLARAQNNLGWMYTTGRGVERNYRQAAEWSRKAAAQGNAQAQYRLGTMYANGRGVERDYEQAVMWFRKAAAQGNSYAEEALRRLRRKL